MGKQQLCALAAKCGGKVLYSEVQSSFTSIDKTVQHILRIQKFWTAFVSGKDVTHFDWRVFENEAARILHELKSQSAEMQNIISAFTEEQLVQELQLNMPWAQNQLPRYEYIVHCINHSTYHRGQIVTIARSLGITENIPSSDYNFYFTSQ